MADPNNVPIAIIGMACRFAGDVDTPSKLWDICAEGRSAWSKIPASRFNLDGIYHPNGAKVNTVSKWITYNFGDSLLIIV